MKILRKSFCGDVEGNNLHPDPTPLLLKVTLIHMFYGWTDGNII